MKKLLNSIKVFCVMGAMAIGAVSCDFLDIVPDDVPTIDHAFQDKAQAEKYLYTCYSYLMPYMDYTKDPAVMGSGEFLSYQTGNGAISLYNLGLITGGQNVSSPICNNWESDSWYDTPYQGIRVCNTFLEKIDEPFDLDFMTKERWIAEVKFLKAYYHYYLMRMYGPIVICDENYDINATPDEIRSYRNTWDECVTYVANLLDEAYENLPARIEKETEEMGRATKAIAKAVKAKLMVLNASPLFNGNANYADITDARGVKLFPEAGADKEKWGLAVSALEDAISEAEGAGHTLYTLGTHAYTLNDELELQLQIRNKIWDRWNTETVWGYTKTSTYWLQAYAIPRLHADALKSSAVKGGSLAPTHFVADLYYTENGVPMEEDKTFDYDNRHELRAATEEEKWKVSINADAATGLPFVTAQQHFNREPRFYASIGFDGGIWWGNGKSDINKYDELYTLSSKFSQLQGMTWASLYSVTGYYAKKLVAPDTTFSATSFTAEACPFPIIRMSDLYLLYAEALNEYNDAPTNQVYQIIDAIRAKAGLKGVKESWRNYSNNPAKPESKAGMREIIQRERMIELAMEGQTMWDIRRWMKGTEYWNGKVEAWNVSGKSPAEYYNKVVLTYAFQKFSQRDYLWPISQNQMLINPKLKQNYGW